MSLFISDDLIAKMLEELKNRKVDYAAVLTGEQAPPEVNILGLYQKLVCYLGYKLQVYFSCNSSLIPVISLMIKFKIIHLLENTFCLNTLKNHKNDFRLIIFSCSHTHTSSCQKFGVTLHFFKKHLDIK